MMHKVVQAGSRGLNGGGEAGRGECWRKGTRLEDNYNNPGETQLEQREVKGNAWGNDGHAEGRDKRRSGV